MDDEHAHLALVDIGTHHDEDTIRRLYQGGLIENVEGIGTDQYQITMGVQAPNVGEAYRKAVNYVDSVHSADDAYPETYVMGATIYPPDDGEPVTFD